MSRTCLCARSARAHGRDDMDRMIKVNKDRETFDLQVELLIVMRDDDGDVVMEIVEFCHDANVGDDL